MKESYNMMNDLKSHIDEVNEITSTTTSNILSFLKDKLSRAKQDLLGLDKAISNCNYDEREEVELITKVTTRIKVLEELIKDINIDEDI